MHQQLVIANLKCKGTSLAAVARDLGKSYSTVYSVLVGQRSKVVEAAIAAALGLPVEEVFPNRYPGKVSK
jgi:lambda repressor-like predicted transcriptional regulator